MTSTVKSAVTITSRELLLPLLHFSFSSTSAPAAECGWWAVSGVGGGQEYYVSGEREQSVSGER